MINIFDALTAWLKDCGCTDIQPVIVKIGRKVYQAVWYSQGVRRDWLYVLGELPKFNRFNKIVYVMNGVDYYVVCYTSDSSIVLGLREIHPFGANFILAERMEGEAINAFESKSYTRKLICVSQPEIFSIVSSDGMAECDLTTGMVVMNETDYSMSKIDVKEYQAWRLKHNLPLLKAGQTVDCLLIGWEDLDGGQCLADEQARYDFLQECCEE